MNHVVRLSALFLLVLLLLMPAPSRATIRRTPGGFLYGPTPVWTENLTAILFHPLGEPMASAGMINVRATVELSEKTGNCQIRPALRYSADGINWDAPKEISGAWTTTNSVSAVTAYIDITATGSGFAPKSWVQFGVQASNSASTTPSVCNATLLIEPKEQGL